MSDGTGLLTGSNGLTVVVVAAILQERTAAQAAELAATRSTVTGRGQRAPTPSTSLHSDAVRAIGACDQPALLMKQSGVTAWITGVTFGYFGCKLCIPPANA